MQTIRFSAILLLTLALTLACTLPCTFTGMARQTLEMGGQVTKPPALPAATQPSAPPAGRTPAPTRVPASPAPTGQPTQAPVATGLPAPVGGPLNPNPPVTPLRLVFIHHSTGVAVFDYYNVLTSNGGNPQTHDLDATSGSHHRYHNGTIEHLVGPGDFLAYPGEGPDNHPTAAGHQKATGEFIPLLNIFVHCWQGDGGCPR